MNTAFAMKQVEEHLVPEESAVAMIESCAAQIERAASISDVKKAITMAEAIAAVTRKIDASERVKTAATMLVIEAEIQLGRISKTIPHGRRGKAAVPGQATKHGTLAKHGLHQFRCTVAEKLADTPRARIEEALARAKTKTVVGVTTELGFRQKFAAHAPRSAWQKVAKDAIELLEKCRKQVRPPTDKEVGPIMWTFVALEEVQ